MITDGPVPTVGDGFSASVRVRLDLGYDGTEFLGWAIQPQGRTVQGEIESALSRILGQQIRLTVAGRTDAGVHARAQVAHFDLDPPNWQRHRDRLLHRLNGLLPPDVRVSAISQAPVGFDARFSALARHYIYRIAIGAPDPLARRDQIHRSRGLDVAAMQEAAQALLGEHDFLAFCKPREGATTIRTLQRCEVLATEWGVEVHFSADAFCHSMVRALMGALVAVGEGRRDLDWIKGLLDVSSKPHDVQVMPAPGLTLERVDYPADDELAARAHLTRARRDISAGE